MSKEKVKMREEVAGFAHLTWQRWMGYMLSHLDNEHIERWKRQANTPYNELPEAEKASDRAIADRYLSLSTDTCRIKIAPSRKIVCLCGSTRFMEAFFDVGWELTLKGYIVLSIGVCKHAEDHGGEALGPEVADRLDELHLRKIDLADEVWILNVGGYIGESTRMELEYAQSIGKPIVYLERG